MDYRLKSAHLEYGSIEGGRCVKNGASPQVGHVPRRTCRKTFSNMGQSNVNLYSYLKRLFLSIYIFSLGAIILSYNLKIKIYGYHYIHSVCLLSSTAYSIIVTVLNEYFLKGWGGCV